MVTIREIKIKGPDAYQLGATVFVPTHLKAAILIGSATGIKRRFYHSFADYLANNGYGMITFDYEGIGESKNGDLKKSKASLVSWGKQDMSLAFSALQSEFPKVPYHLIGHSAGGQLVGLMEDATKLTSIFNFASSSGSLQNMKFPFKLKAHFFMNVFIPLNNFFFGFTKSQWVGMGEPLPKGCAQQWSEWCNSTGYVKKYIENTNIKHSYQQLACPSFWINAIDDDIAIDKNVEDMILVFPKIQVKRLKLDPNKYQLNEVGHMKFFSKKNKILWQIALDWFDQF